MIYQATCMWGRLSTLRPVGRPGEPGVAPPAADVVVPAGPRTSATAGQRLPSRRMGGTITKKDVSLLCMSEPERNELVGGDLPHEFRNRLTVRETETSLACSVG
jgi:hypothetical protein